MNHNDNYIRFENITKTFAGQRAVNDVSFGIKKGEIHAIMGENGAGKSTLLNLLHGVHQPSNGNIYIDGKITKFHSIHDGIVAGICKVHQEINVVSELTVMQNLMLGSELSSFGFAKKKEMIKETNEILKRLKCNFSAMDKIGPLSAGHKQMLQIARALRTNAKIISFDEPTASLSNNEVDILFDIMRDLNNQGITILYISHKLDEVLKICDRATILRDGKYINTYEMKETSKEELIKSMVGRDVSMFAKRTKPSCVKQDKTVLKVENLSGETFQNISFDLKQSEILGFFGLVGAQRTEVMRTIFGADKRFEGKIYRGNELINNKTPNEAIGNGFAFVSENRKEEGFIKEFSNSNNIALASLSKYMERGIVSKKLKNENSVHQGSYVGLYPNDPDFYTNNLSGGNAQKVILAKWLSTDAEIIILDEPTKGIDVGAKTEIYKLMEDMIEKGKSIILVSSELTEVMGMSDKIIVMNEGRMVGELDKSDFSEKGILSDAIGGN
ncbi:MAG: sugar ABC transporter ATP-binding protein [Firmicutes bacterium HGW-Firmicutes-1]|jgi:ABC-type sugar transport system ATPase subunit|nr:MAG: sugar ABC transporter ATP-binding protein [Firmicutes bacterium HGW-Firmicutes-1]